MTFIIIFLFVLVFVGVLLGICLSEYSFKKTLGEDFPSFISFTGGHPAWWIVWAVAVVLAAGLIVGVEVYDYSNRKAVDIENGLYTKQVSTKEIKLDGKVVQLDSVVTYKKKK